MRVQLTQLMTIAEAATRQESEKGCDFGTLDVFRQQMLRPEWPRTECCQLQWSAKVGEGPLASHNLLGVVLPLVVYQFVRYLPTQRKREFGGMT